jgi:hypothetical protein
MQNNNPNDYLQEDEIDFKEIFKLLINSKKLIIVTTFIITLLAAIYTTQKEPIYKSTALIETGSYQMEVIDKNGGTIDYKIKLIEPTETLIKELTIHFIHKQKANLSINSIEDTLIKINSTSLDPVKNTDLLNKVIQYIENRHSNLLINHTQKIKNQLTYKIERLNDHIEYSFSALLLRISNQIESLNNELPNLDTKIESLNEIIVADKGNLLLLKSNPDLFLQRAAQFPTLDQVIHSYSVQLLDFENEKIKLSHENNNLKSQLKLLENNNLESDEIFELLQEKDSQQIAYLLQPMGGNDIESEKIFELLQEKDSLELELEFLMQKNSTSTQLIGEIVTSTFDLKKDLIILLGFIFGFFLGIVMVFVNNFLKTFKEK